MILSKLWFKISSNLIKLLNSWQFKFLRKLSLLLFYLLTIPNEIFNESSSLDALNYTSYINLGIIAVLLIDIILIISLSLKLNSQIGELIFLLSVLIIYGSLLIIHLILRIKGNEYVTVYGFSRLVRCLSIIILYRYIMTNFYNSDLDTNMTFEIEKPKESSENMMPIDRIFKLFKNLKKKIPLYEKEIFVEIDKCLDLISKNNLFSPFLLNDENNTKAQNEDMKRTKEEVFST